VLERKKKKHPGALTIVSDVEDPLRHIAYRPYNETSSALPNSVRAYVLARNTHPYKIAIAYARTYDAAPHDIDPHTVR
jgi:hypothetical protein